VILSDSGPATLRAVRPDDGQALQRFFERLTPEDIRLRFFAPLRELPDGHMARLLNVDPERELALVLEREGEVLAIGRIACEHGVPERAEFAVTVRSDLQGRRIGTYFLNRLIDFARDRGVTEIYGDILAENAAMISVVEELGFRVEALEETTAIRRAVRPL
jgi:acetyltransferase